LTALFTVAIVAKPFFADRLGMLFFEKKGEISLNK
jgi:hypothetical protein